MSNVNNENVLKKGVSHYANLLTDSISNNIRTYTMIIALVVIWILFGFLTDGVFFTPRNMSMMVRQMTLIGILAIGMVPVIVTGNIDLSVGSVVGFISVIVAYFQVYIFPDLLAGAFPAYQEQMTVLGINTSINGILSTLFSIGIALLVGLVIGIWQGALIAYLKIPAFIVTLGGFLIFKGGILYVTKGRTISPVDPSLNFIAQGYVSKGMGLAIGFVVIACIFLIILWGRKQKLKYGFDKYPIYKDILKASGISAVIMFYVLYVANSYEGFQNPVLLMLIIAVIFSYITTNTRFGRYIYALGGNKEATRLSGVNINRTIFKVYIMMGILCAISGVVLTGYVGSGTTTGGNLYELFTIAACVIGGTSLMGGEGTIAGAIVGALVMGSLGNGMEIMNMGDAEQYIVKGLVLVFAVYVDVRSKRKG